MKKECFGEILKRFRLDYAKMGLRTFANKVGMLPSDLYEIEHSYQEWPRSMPWIETVLRLTTPPSMAETNLLFDAYMGEFTKKKKPKNFIVISAIDAETGQCVTDSERIKEVEKFINKE